MESLIIIKDKDHLVCDNSECNYRVDVPFELFTEWINTPCPQCRSNLLTYEDYERVKYLYKSIDTINSLSPEELQIMNESLGPLFPEELQSALNDIKNNHPDATFNLEISTHKELRIKKITIDKK